MTDEKSELEDIDNFLKETLDELFPTNKGTKIMSDKSREQLAKAWVRLEDPPSYDRQTIEEWRINDHLAGYEAGRVDEAKRLATELKRGMAIFKKQGGYIYEVSEEKLMECFPEFFKLERPEGEI